MRAQTSSVNSEGAAQNQQPNLLHGSTRNARGWARTKFFSSRSVRSLAVRARAPHFFSQGNFFTAIENKIDFFLVRFVTDFYSQARWRGRQ